MSEEHDELRARLRAADPASSLPRSDPDRVARLLEALAAMRPEDAELLRLWAWEQLTPAEIATVLDITSNAASTRLTRAKRKLSDRLRKSAAAAGHEESREGRNR